jgi:ATP-binding cassette, subfamily B, bacterial PglK
MKDRGLLYRAKQILMPSHKTKAPFIIFLQSVSSLLDFISLASFLPVILLILNPLHSTEAWIPKWIKVWATEPDDIGIVFTILILLFIILKIQINLWIAQRKATYAYEISADLASLALTKYLTSPYGKFTNTDYTKEMNRISNLPLMFANNILIPAGTVLSEGLLLTMFFVCVAIYDIKVLGFVMLITSPVGLVYWLKRKRSKHISEEVKTVYPKVLKYTLETIEGFPEIKAFGKENYFKRRFNTTFQRLRKVFTSDHVVNTSAQRTTELIAALCVGALIVYALLQRNPVHETVLLLSIYAGVSFRAIPAVNRIFSALLQMKSHEYILHDLQDLVAPPNGTVEGTEVPLHFSSNIELRNICFRYEENSLILQNASLMIQKGERVILTGPSGAGKTSLFLILMRFMNEDSGEILVDGEKIMDINVGNWRRLIGYVPQNPFILDATIAENIAFGVSVEEIDMTKVSRLIRELNLDSWLANQKHGLNTVIGEKGSRISGGQKQRLAIARALYHDAEILLLDEITNQLDKQTEIEVLHALNGLADERKTVLLITHRPELWQSFDIFYELREGKFHKIIQREIHSN